MRRAVALLGFAALAIAGCSKSAPKAYDDQTVATADQFRNISAAFNQAYQQHRRPLSADDLKPFLKQYGDPEKILVSPRDNQAIVIVPGFTPDVQRAEDERSIVAYERTGQDGKRMTVDVRGTIVFVTDAEFATLKFAGGHKPPGR